MIWGAFYQTAKAAGASPALLLSSRCGSRVDGESDAHVFASVL